LRVFSERERNRLRAQKALASGKTREAEQFFQKAIEITPEMVLNVIRVEYFFFLRSNEQIDLILGTSNDGY
jgi:hypothetical protein